MRKLTSLLLLFLCGMATSWADYEVGKLLTAAEVNAGVEQVCLFINQDQGIHFYITGEGTGSDDFVTTDKTCVFDFVKGNGGVYLRNSNGQFVVNQMGTFALSSDQSQAATFRATQREDGVGNVVAPSSETVMLTDLGYSQNLNSINISGSRSNTLTFNGGTGVWTCFRVYKVNEVTGAPTVKSFTMNCARGYVAGDGSALKGVTDASEASVFALVPYGETTYLYDVTNKAFAIGSVDDQSALPTAGETTVTRESATDFSRIITGVAFGETGIASYPTYLYDKWGNYLNMDGAKRVYFNTWTDFEGGAGGNTYVINEVADFDATEAVAALDAFFNPSATYKIVVVDSETEQEFTVAEGVAAAIGDVISDMPDNLKRDYCNYTVAEPLTVQAGSDNTLFVEADYEGLPFEAGKWYYMTVRSAYAVAGEGTITCQATMPEASNDAAAWSFSGNPYTGIAVKNRSTGDGYTIGYDAVVVDRPGADLYMKSGDTRWIISQNTGGFVLRIPENQSIYLHNRNPKLSTCSVSEWAGVHNDAGSTIALVEIPEPIDPSMYTTPVDATIDMTTGTFTEYNGATLEESLLAKRWVSNESPKIDFYCTGGNNMVGGSLIFNGHDAGNNIGIFAGKTYQITAEKGYVISGYTITGVNMDNASSTITAGSQSHEFTTEESTFDVTLDALAYSTSFDVTGTQFLKLSSFVVHLMKAVPAPEAEYTEGEFNVTSLVDGKVLNVDENNLAMVENVVSGEFGCDITSNGNGTFTVGLPGMTVSGQHHLHIGSGGNWSNGDATATTFYEVADPAAETLSAKAVESLTLGKTYVLVGVREGANYALSSTLVNAGDASKQRLAGVPATINEGELIMERDATILWTMGHAGEVEETTGLTSGTYLFRNLAGEADKFLGVDVNLSVVDLDALVPTKAVTFSSPETGVFNLKLGGLAAYLSCGSNGRFSRNTVANAIRLFEIEDVTADPFVATQVASFKEGHNYLLVGAKSGADYALTAELYNAGQGDDQRMVGTAVTIEEGVISVAKDDKLVWTINEATRPEVVVFEPQPVGEAVDVALYVYANDELVDMNTFQAHVGDVLTDIPEDLKKPFTEYTLAAPFTVGAEDNNLMVDASFNLPFEVDKYYYVKLNGKYMQYDAVRNVGHMGEIDNGDFTYTPMTLEEIEAAEDAKTFHWSISGDPYHHFKLFNEGTQSYLTAAANGYTGVGEEATLVDIAPRGEGLTFTCQYGVLVDFWSTYTAVQENSTGNTDENAVTTLEEVKSEQQGETLQFTIGQDSGTMSGNAGSSWQNYWISNSEDPKVTFSNASAANLSYGGQTAPYIDIRSGKSQTSPYLVTVSDGYLIMGYHIVGSAMTEAQTITYDGGTYVFESGAGESSLDYTFEEPVTKFNFTLTGPNTGLKGYIILDLKKLVSAPVQYVVNGEDGENWITETLPTEVGTQLTALPETLVRPFTEYSCDKTIVVDAEKENVFTVTAKFTAFQISKEGDEKPFRIKTGTGRYLHANAEGALEAVESEVTPAEDDDTFDFLFFGNPYTGFTIKNANTGTFINVPTITAYSAAANLAEEATVFSVAEQEGGVFQFRTPTQAGREAALGDGAQSNGGYQATQVCAWISYLDEEKTSADLTFEANFEEPSDPEKDYPINFDKTQTPTNASRWVSTVSLDDQQIVVCESASDHTLAYRDLREQPGFAVEAGQTVKPAVGYMAEWMHTYAYVDYDRDGQFKVEPTAITEGIIGEGQEIVSFSHYEGYNSAGEAVADGNKTIDMPEFTIPADSKPGYYAMRFKVDWNNVDPAGNPGEGAVGTKQHIITNGGSIIDVRLNVHGENVKVTSISNDASSSVALDDNTSLAEAVEVPFGQEIGLRFAPAEGKKVASFSVRHGYFNGDEYVHGVRQYAVEDVDGADVVRNRYYLPLEWCDGDIEISVVFDEDTGIQNINGLSNDDVIYGVDGRRMNQRNILNKGVYVINGKKVLVK